MATRRPRPLIRNRRSSSARVLDEYGRLVTIHRTPAGDSTEIAQIGLAARIRFVLFPKTLRTDGS